MVVAHAQHQFTIHYRTTIHRQPTSSIVAVLYMCILPGFESRKQASTHRRHRPIPIHGLNTLFSHTIREMAPVLLVAFSTYTKKPRTTNTYVMLSLHIVTDSNSVVRSQSLASHWSFIRELFRLGLLSTVVRFRAYTMNADDRWTNGHPQGMNCQI